MIDLLKYSRQIEEIKKERDDFNRAIREKYQEDKGRILEKFKRECPVKFGDTIKIVSPKVYWYPHPQHEGKSMVVEQISVGNDGIVFTGSILKKDGSIGLLTAKVRLDVYLQDQEGQANGD